MTSDHLLSSRIPETTGSEASAQNGAHLVFDVEGQPYACPIHKIQHLVCRVDVSIQPSAAPALPGEVGKLAGEARGEDVPVLSLRALWELPGGAVAAGQSREAILIVDLGGKSCALLVDSCRCVLPHLPEDQAPFHLSPELQSTKGRAFKVATPWAESLLVVLDLDRLLETTPEPAREPAPVAAPCP